MLSHDLKALSDRFSSYQLGGMEITPEGVADLVACLKDLALQADQLEAATIAPAAKLSGHDLPDNVVRIATVLARKGVTVGPRPVGGGDAA